MNSEKRPHYERVDAYLDGAMSLDEQKQFELAMAGDAALRAEAERGASINESLRTMCAPPSVPAWVQSLAGQHFSHGRINGSANGAAAGIGVPLTVGAIPKSQMRASSGRILRMPRFLAMAAAVALLVSGALLTVFSMGIGGGYDGTEFRTLAQAYADIDEPQWVCETQEQFSGTFAGRFEQPILFVSDDPDASVAGLAYCHTLTRNTVCLVGKAGGAKVLVFVDRLERDPKPSPPADSDLNLFRRELGGLVLYEISPNNEAKLLDWIHTTGD